MNKIEGLYTAITSIIREKEEKYNLVISTDDMVTRLKDQNYLDSVPREVLEDYLLRFAVAIGLNDNGYRSVVKGEGLYINLENCERAEFLNRLFNNAVEMEQQKEQVVSLILKQRERAGIAGQTSIDPETGMIIEDITEEQLLDLLRKEAVA